MLNQIILIMKNLKSNNSGFILSFLLISVSIFSAGKQSETVANDRISLEVRQQPPEKWNYIEVDSTRAKWGDWDQPEWLRYFGLDMMDVTGNGYKDIIAGRYFYRNPGGDMTNKWDRVDLGMNVDGMLFVEMDNSNTGNIIATALPDVFWFSACDREGTSW